MIILFSSSFSAPCEKPLGIRHVLILERKALIGGMSHVIQMRRGDWPKVRYCSTDSEIEFVEIPTFNNKFKHYVNSVK